MQTKHAQNELLSIGEAASRIGISRDTLRRWENDGRISSLRTPTNHRRYRSADVDALLAKGDGK